MDVAWRYKSLHFTSPSTSGYVSSYYVSIQFYSRVQHSSFKGTNDEPCYSERAIS